MHCNEIRELISCMLDNELSAEESALVTEHVAGCPECMRVFEAFHAVSVTFEEMEEVPAGFTADVMERIHAAAAPKKRNPRILRYVAMAACCALVLMVGSGFASVYGGGTSQRSNDTAQHTENPTQYAVKHNGATTNNDSKETEDSSLISGLTVDDHAVNDDSDVMQADPASGEESGSVSAVYADEPLDSGMTTTDSPAATPVPQPVEQSAADLLTPAEEAEPGLYDDPADYTVVLTTEDGEVEVSVWIREGKVYCMDTFANTAWFAVGTPEQLIELLEPIPSSDIVVRADREAAISPAQ